MTHLSIVSQYGGRMLVVLVLSTLIGLAVTALLLNRLWRQTPTNAVDDTDEAQPRA
jgi:holin-like protein